MSNNLENDRSVTTGKMYPIDLAPQKITIVKSVSNTEVKMAHLLPGQPKTPGQIITHAGPVGLMRPTAQIISPGVATQQPQMIVSGSPILQGTQIVSQGSQLIGQSSQIISQPTQLINPSGQLISPGTQIISQGSQLSAQVSSTNNTSNVQTNISTPVSGAQVLNVGGQLVSGSGNLLVSSSVRALSPSVRVLPPLPHHNNRPAVLSTVNVSTASGVLVNKGVTHHVPRGLAAGASLAVRPVAPALPVAQGGPWPPARARGALVYGSAPLPRTTPRAPTTTPVPPSSPAPHSAIVTLPTTTVLTSSVISSAVRSTTPRPSTPAPAPQRPLALLQRNYQPAKVVGVASVGVRGSVGNSAPAQLYYEVPRPAAPHTLPPARPLAPYHQQPAQGTTLSVVNTVQTLPESRPQSTPAQMAPMLPRPSILRKRDIDGSPTKNSNSRPFRTDSAPPCAGTGWEDVPSGDRGTGSGGSTTMSAASSPPPEDEPDLPRIDDMSPRKKPRKQILTNEVRQCEFPTEETPVTPPPAPAAPPPKRPLLSSHYVCGWRATALHFTRPSDVRRREPRKADIVHIAGRKHARASADGWKVHHLTAQMDDLVSLEADVGEQLAGVLRALESASSRTNAALQSHSHNLLELIKGNIQRSKIVCEGIQEARMDILNVFTHRTYVSEILSRQADKRCFRKHRSQS